MVTNVTGSRIAEMNDEIARWRDATLQHLTEGGEGTSPEPPSFSPEEFAAWIEASRVEHTERMVAAFRGKAAWDRINVQHEARTQARADADRAIAIVEASIVEEQLKAAIERYFPGRHLDPKVTDRMFDPQGGLLGNFTARADMAFALGIIGPGARTALKKIAEIRNLFAHRLEIHSFENTTIGKLVDKLTYIDFAITGPDAEGFMHLWHRTPNSEVRSGAGFRAADNPFDSRGKFEKTCQFLQEALRKSEPTVVHPDLHEK